MKHPRHLLLLTWLIYAGFLVFGGFRGDSPLDAKGMMAPSYGFGWVLFGFFHVPPVLLSMLWLRFADFALLPFSLANLAFFALPGLHLSGYTRRPRLNQVLHWSLLIGAGGFAVMLWQARFNPPAWPAYLWLAAIIPAVG